MIPWILTALSVLGTVANIYKKRYCFLLWGITNAAWAVIDYQAGIPAQAALFVTYFGLAIWGLVRWKGES